MFTTRRLASARAIPRLAGATCGFPRASFHTSPFSLVQVGDRIPDLDVLTEDSPGNKVNLAKELATGKGLIIGVPAAFSTCQLLHCVVSSPSDCHKASSPHP